jgi:hypothetical protein
VAAEAPTRMRNLRIAAAAQSGHGRSPHSGRRGWAEPFSARNSIAEEKKPYHS